MANNVSNVGFSDYSADQAEIDRRRKMAEALQQQGLQPVETQMAGGWAIPNSPTQYLAKALQAYSGSKGVQDADAKQRALAERVRTDRAGDMSAIAAALQPAQAPATPNDDDGNANPMVAGGGGISPQLLAQLRSPDMQQAAFSAYMQQAGPKAPIKLGAGDSLVDPTTFKPLMTAPKPQEGFTLTPGATRFGPDGKPIAAAPNKDEGAWSEPYQMGGAQVQRNKITGEIRQAVARPPVTNVTTNVSNSGPRAFETELGKLDAEQLGKYRTDAQAANQTLGLVQNLRAAEQQGIYSGGGAQAKTAVASLVNGLTGATPKGLVGSETFNSEASKLVLERIKMLGANPSNADREFIEKTVPQLSTSPEARNAIIGFLEQKARQSVELYQRADAHARKNHGLGGFNMFASPGTDIHSEAEAILRGNK